VGLALQGFGVRNFGVYEHLMHKQNEIRNAKLRKEIRVWAQQFQVSVFGKAKELLIYVTSMPHFINRGNEGKREGERLWHWGFK
jgi:hypothetical protein